MMRHSNCLEKSILTGFEIIAFFPCIVMQSIAEKKSFKVDLPWSPAAVTTESSQTRSKVGQKVLE